MTNRITLKLALEEAKKKKVAIGHFNISDLTALQAIFESARELGAPVIIGVSEGEREFIGVQRSADLVKSIREEYNYPIFTNADHTYSLDGIKEAVEAGFDMVIFDGAKLSYEENISKTKEAVKISRAINPDVLVEGEIGYIGSSSKILEKTPEGALVDEAVLPTADLAKNFVTETGVDLLAPAVGNLHGMFKNAPNPNLKITRIKDIAEATGISLVLHGGSGVSDEDFTRAIDAGIRVIHINTEIRVAWRRGIEDELKAKPDEIAPYKILPAAVHSIKEVVINRLKLFNGL